MIVVDTNVVAHLYLESEFTARAEAQLGSDPDWAVPLLWRSEFRNILAGAMRRRVLSFDEARRVLTEVLAAQLGTRLVTMGRKLRKAFPLLAKPLPTT